MYRSLKNLFQQYVQPQMDSKDPQAQKQALRLATAALLVEASRADFEADDEERNTILNAVQLYFNLAPAESEILVNMAEQAVDTSSSLYEFTGLINRHCSMEQKIEIIEMMWEVVFTDSHKDKHEEYMVRKVADLLHVPPSAFARTRHEVEIRLKDLR